jgi:cell division cycle protein 20 (cofactor of APC complex)
MNMATSQFQIASHKEGNNRNQFLDTSTLAYQEEVARACGVALDRRILAFSAEAPPSQTSTKQLIKQSWNRPLKHTTRRKIAQAPEKVLDAPGYTPYISNLYIL